MWLYARSFQSNLCTRYELQPRSRGTQHTSCLICSSNHTNIDAAGGDDLNTYYLSVISQKLCKLALSRWRRFLSNINTVTSHFLILGSGGMSLSWNIRKKQWNTYRYLQRNNYLCGVGRCCLCSNEFSSKRVWLLMVNCWIECCNSDNLEKSMYLRCVSVLLMLTCIWTWMKFITESQYYHYYVNFLLSHTIPCFVEKIRSSMAAKPAW